MKQRSPIIIVFWASLFLGLLMSAIGIGISLYISRLPVWLLIVLPSSFSVIIFVVFYRVMERFINHRIGIIYRTIRKGKFSGQTQPTHRVNSDIFTQIEHEANEWAEERDSEISKLKEQEEFRREFLGNLAHELKTPVFSIQGYILTLLDGGLEDEQVNRLFLERASGSIDRLLNLLEDLDSITKMEVNGLQMEWSNFDIREAVQEVFDALALKAEEKNITLKFSKDYASQVVRADRGRILQVLTNLVANSIHYGNTDGTTSVRFFEMNNLVLIEISDNGPGIEPEDLSRIFERFYRVEKSRNRNAGGSGLGLAIAKHMVESHGQRLTVRSSVGLGSTFAFSLDKPLTTQEPLLSSRGVKIR